MRDYQRKKDNPYKLPHNVYMQNLYFIRDYDRLKNEPSEESRAKCRKIEEALNEIPKEYQKGVWNNICYHSPYPIDAGASTYQRWRSRFIYHVSKKRKEI